jgi:undecaprenol kinase
MIMGSVDKQRLKPIWHSFSYAITGIFTAVKQERNMRFHLLSSVLVVGISFYFSITATEWLFILFAVGGMFALELVNTAIERVVDLAAPDFHPLAKQAKDVAAGAVFVYAILSVVIGIVIFSPYFLRLLHRG